MKFRRLHYYWILIKDLKQRKAIRMILAFVLFPFSYIYSFINAKNGIALLVKPYLTELTIFDKIIASRLKKILPKNINHYLESKQEFSKDTKVEFIVLKPFVSHDEKGVISIHWQWFIDVLVKNYDYLKILDKYMIILESDFFGAEWSMPFFSLLSHGDSHVFLSAKNALIFKRYDLLGFRTIPYGVSSDYINSERFTFIPNIKKEIDVIMIAHWDVSIKRHFCLFRALKKIKSSLNIALIGFPLDGYTKEYIWELTKYYSLEQHYFCLYENINSHEVQMLLNKSKVCVLTSLLEGANRVCFESFFVNVPVIILTENMSIPKEYFNSKTGIVAKEKSLHNCIMQVLGKYDEFTPRQWALQNISPVITIEKINNWLRKWTNDNGLQWTEDLVVKQWKGQLFEYVAKDMRDSFKDDYNFISGCHKYRLEK